MKELTIISRKKRLRKDKEISILAQQIKFLKNSIQSMQGNNSYGGVSFFDLSVASGEIIPVKFKMLDLTTKYDGSANPFIHLKIYVSKLGASATDERLEVHLFPKSLTGAALCWFV